MRSPWLAYGVAALVAVLLLAGPGAAAPPVDAVAVEYMSGLGVRLGSGDGIYSRELFGRVPAGVLDFLVPAGVTAAWEARAAYWDAGRRADGWMLAAGPVFELGLGDSRLSLTAGWQPTWLSRSTFDGRDLGGRFQFTSHVGLRWRPGRRLSIGYSLSHTSNAGIYEENPGVDMQALEFGYRF